MKVIGITGSSGSGKTTLSKILNKRDDVRVIDADKVVRELSVPGTEYLNAIKETFDLGDNSQGKMLITNARHKQLIDQAAEALRRGLNQYKAGMPLDCITYDMWQSAGYLGEIVGESVSEEIIDSIFDRFCLGK